MKGCKKCNGCLNSPIRGNYDGLVILSVITKDILPFASIPVSDVTNVTIRNKDQYMDHERFAVYLENVLTSHFMFREKEFALKCVSTSKVAYAMEEAISSKRSIDPIMLGLLGADKDSIKTRKFPGYAIYLGYRLRRRSLAQIADNTNIRIGKRLSFIATLKKQYSQRKFNKDKINQEIHNGINSKGPPDWNTDDEFGMWRRKFSQDIEPGRGTGEYEIIDLEDNEYGNKEMGIVDDDKPRERDDKDDDDVPAFKGDEADDEKLLEELENKQLMFKMETLQDDYNGLRDRIHELQTGEVSIDNRLLALEDSTKNLEY